MSSVIFYEKPGCVTNRKQKAILQEAGLSLQVKNLLNHPWQRQELASYFQDLPVDDWFNPSAPDVKNGQLQVHGLDSETALDLLINDPLLIRRPLLDVDGVRMAGFSPLKIETVAKVALQQTDVTQQALETCSQTLSSGGCP